MRRPRLRLSRRIVTATRAIRAPPSPRRRPPEQRPDRPRTDTVALVEQNASRPREVPTWFAVIAILALSLVAGMATYLVRMRSSAPSDPGTTTTASAAYDKARRGQAARIGAVADERGRRGAPPRSPGGGPARGREGLRRARLALRLHAGYRDGRGAVGASRPASSRSRRSSWRSVCRASAASTSALGEDAEGVFLVRRAPSLTLDAMAKGERVEGLSALAKVRDLARALDACERAAIFPGPLRPADVALSGVGRTEAWIVAEHYVRALVGDAMLASGTSSGPSPRWTPPEQASGAPWDNAANRYVLGLVAYRLIAGAHPFSGIGLRDAMRAQAESPPPFDDDVARALRPGLQSLVLAMLDPDATKRPRPAAELVRRFEEILREGEPARAVNRPPPPVPARALAPARAPARAPAPAPAPRSPRAHSRAARGRSARRGSRLRLVARERSTRPAGRRGDHATKTACARDRRGLRGLPFAAGCRVAALCDGACGEEPALRARSRALSRSKSAATRAARTVPACSVRQAAMCVATRRPARRSRERAASTGASTAMPRATASRRPCRPGAHSRSRVAARGAARRRASPFATSSRRARWKASRARSAIRRSGPCT